MIPNPEKQLKSKEFYSPERNMPAQIIDGKSIAQDIKNELKIRIRKLKEIDNLIPGLAVVLVGENPSSQVYVNRKQIDAQEIGVYSFTEKLSDTITQKELVDLIEKFNLDPRIHGILVQSPLPKHINEHLIYQSINPQKDVDGFHPVNMGKLLIGDEDGFIPCTPAGVQELLIRSRVSLAGKHVVIIGRSNIVGKPLASILMQKKEGANAVVTICHTGANDRTPFTRQAEVLIAAIGKPEIIRGDMLSAGCVVIDVGVNRIEDKSKKNGYRIVGDVHFESANRVAKMIAPVPGGVGPMTIAMLLRNTVVAAERTVIY